MTFDMISEEFSRIVNNAGRNVFGLTGAMSYIVPGWNRYLKELFDMVRRSFLAWRHASSPRNGIVANDMRRRRVIIYAELKRCMKDEECTRAEALASKLQSGTLVSFWKDMKSIWDRKQILSKCIEVI